MPIGLITSLRLRRPLVLAAAAALHVLAVIALLNVRRPPETLTAAAPPLTLITVVPLMPEFGLPSGMAPLRPRDLPPPAFTLTQPTITFAPSENPTALGDDVRCGLPSPFWREDRERCEGFRAQIQTARPPPRIPSDREIQMVAKFERENPERHAPKRMPCSIRRAKGSSIRCGSEPTWRDEDF